MTYYDIIRDYLMGKEYTEETRTGIITNCKSKLDYESSFSVICTITYPNGELVEREIYDNEDDLAKVSLVIG